MYTNFWYTAAASGGLAKGPVKVKMLGQNFVLFRDSAGTAHCLSNACTHRGGSLGNGKVHTDTIECPYHGWQFNGAGECTKIPSIGKGGKIPSRTRIDSYPVQEKYGLVFAFLGDCIEEQRPPVMDVPEYGIDGWKPSIMYNEYAANYERSVENTLDPGHNEFVHPTHGFEGTKDDYKVQDYTLDETEYGCGFTMIFQSPALTDVTMKKLRGFAGDLEAGTGHFGPHQTWTKIHMSPTNWFHQYTFRTPVDETHTRSWLVNMRNALLEDEHDIAIEKRQRAIAQQDIVVLEELEPILAPLTNTKENMMPHDKALVRYREYLRTWDAKGWRIDSAQVTLNEKKIVYAVPSPDRNKFKGWVIDPIPTEALACT
ncbi:MAG: aromatic ring-hydroxylating dioxygenase subunit alpha [Rhodospirillaceae bacterium]|nr:aromatic ring-hydroxylating dioxygenase subunit alpha [Rhodospirillaceae bacterium]